MGIRLAVDCANLEREAERAWAVSKDTTTIAVLEEFVRRYGDSHYAALARARMEELRKSQAAPRPRRGQRADQSFRLARDDREHHVLAE